MFNRSHSDGVGDGSPDMLLPRKDLLFSLSGAVDDIEEDGVGRNESRAYARIQPL